MARWANLQSRKCYCFAELKLTSIAVLPNVLLLAFRLLWITIVIFKFYVIFKFFLHNCSQFAVECRINIPQVPKQLFFLDEFGVFVGKNWAKTSIFSVQRQTLSKFSTFLFKLHFFNVCSLICEAEKFPVFSRRLVSWFIKLLDFSSKRAVGKFGRNETIRSSPHFTKFVFILSNNH